MKNLKLILPMLAFILAIGMSFAFTSAAEDDLVVQIDGQLYEAPINCSEGTQNCTTLISKNGDVLQVQVQRETASGDYEPAKTSTASNMVFDISSLTTINP